MGFSDWTAAQLRDRMAEYHVQMAGDLTPDERIILRYTIDIVEDALAVVAARGRPKRLVFGVDSPPQPPILTSGGKGRKRR